MAGGKMLKLLLNHFLNKITDETGALVSKNYTFTTGNTIVAAEHNSNFDVLFNLVNGNLENANIASGAAIANSKLAAPKSYFTVALTRDGQFTTGVDNLCTFQMPFAATLVEASACARDIDRADGTEVYSIDVLEASSSVLSAVINLTADATPVIGAIADATIADNAVITIDLDVGGTTPAIDDITVLLTFKLNHVA